MVIIRARVFIEEGLQLDGQTACRTRDHVLTADQTSSKTRPSRMGTLKPASDLGVSKNQGP